jgi:hypothetical protein
MSTTGLRVQPFRPDGPATYMPDGASNSRCMCLACEPFRHLGRQRGDVIENTSHPGEERWWTGVSARQALLLRSQPSKRCAVAVVRTAKVEPEFARVGEVAIWYLDSALATAACPVEHLNRWDLTIQWIDGKIPFLRLNNTMVCSRQCDNDHYSKQIYGVVSILRVQFYET